MLDFVNTMDDWTDANSQDYLETFEDATRFAEAVGLITPWEARAVERARQARGARAAPGARETRGARGAPGARGFSRANAELTALRQLRGSLERILRASLDERPAPAADVALLRGGFVDAARGTELLAKAGGPLTKRIAIDSNGPAALRLRIVDAAMNLLLSDAMRHVKVCPTCGWFFLDVSKNQSRVWCSMDTCGSRAKAQRYYRRSKQARAHR